ncbi:MAG: hypothetical protein KAV82_16885, partial [Phycisphaerae bacterium]|nr:hypothetical protein [Phycisphaerae bacterium]
MADRRIKIRWATSKFILNQIDGVRVRIDVLCAYGMTPYIFAYRNLSMDPATGEQGGWFDHVCTPADLEEYPKTSPIPGHQPEWFRLNYVDVFLRSRIEADALITDVRSDVRRLKNTLNTMDRIEPEGFEAVGGQLICASSSLSSVSSPSSSSSASLGSPLLLTRWGSFEQSIGAGQEWLPIGFGAGSPIGSSDSLSGSLPYSYSSADLLARTISQTLLIQGYGFDALPDDSVLDGIEAKLLTRWRDGDSSASSLSSIAPATCDQGGGVTWSHEGGPQLFFFKLYHPDLGPVGDERSNNASIY